MPGTIGSSQMAIVHGGEEITAYEDRMSGGIDYERMGEAVAAGNIDAMSEMGGTGSGSSSSADLRTKLAQLLYDPLEIEKQRRGGAIA